MCERVIVDRKVVASQPGLLARAPATGPLVDADPGPHARAQRPPKIENEVDAVAVLAREGIARQMGQTVTKSDIHPESVSGRAILSVRRAAVCEQERAHETGDLGRHHGGCCLCMLQPNTVQEETQRAPYVRLLLAGSTSLGDGIGRAFERKPEVHDPISVPIDLEQQGIGIPFCQPLERVSAVAKVDIRAAPLLAEARVLDLLTPLQARTEVVEAVARFGVVEIRCVAETQVHPLVLAVTHETNPGVRVTARTSGCTWVSA